MEKALRHEMSYARHRGLFGLDRIRDSSGRVGMEYLVYFMGVAAISFTSRLMPKLTIRLVGVECYLIDLRLCASPHHDLALR